MDLREKNREGRFVSVFTKRTVRIYLFLFSSSNFTNYTDSSTTGSESKAPITDQSTTELLKTVSLYFPILCNARTSTNVTVIKTTKNNQYLYI